MSEIEASELQSQEEKHLKNNGLALVDDYMNCCTNTAFYIERGFVGLSVLTFLKTTTYMRLENVVSRSLCSNEVTEYEMPIQYVVGQAELNNFSNVKM